jgi:circadian clock protein KaiB
VSNELPTSSVEELELAAKALDSQRYVLRLFITGMTPRSTRAIRLVREVCEQQLKGRYELDIVDVYQQPALIRDEQILATPTLVKYAPAPRRHIIGDMSSRERMLKSLGLADSQS